MKSAKASMILATLVALSCLGPQASWATRVFDSVVTGTVTAVPTRTDIEVDNVVYHFTPNSAADQQAHTAQVGQVVDLTLDPTVSPTSPMVVSVNVHGGT